LHILLHRSKNLYAVRYGLNNFLKDPPRVTPPKPKPKSKSTSSSTPLHSHLSALAPYPPGKPIEEVQREYGLKHVVKLASNENPLGPSPRALRAMAAAAGEMNLYPDGAGHYLKLALAKKLGVTPEEIVLGNGSDEITLFLALAYLGPGRSLVTSNYAFVRYVMAAQLVNAEPRIVPMKNFRHDPRALAAAVTKSTALVCVDNPCNPTGTILKKAELAKLLRAIPAHVPVLVDEAYYEFACGDPEYPDTLALRKRHPNLIITRTFSKAYGLAGLRIGYGIARPEIVRDLERVRPPFNTSRMAQAAALAALGDAPHLNRSVKVNDQGKQYLLKQLARLGIPCVPTHANFILADFSGRCESGAALYEQLLRRGVIVRPMGGYGLANHLRISIGTAEENSALLTALQAVAV